MRHGHLFALGAVAVALLAALVMAGGSAAPSQPAASPGTHAGPVALAGTPSPHSACCPAAAPTASPVAARSRHLTQPAAPAAAAPTQAGMVVAVDPETGQLTMPSQEQLSELASSQAFQLNESSDGLVEVHHPDGSVSIDLQGRFQDYAVAMMGKDGKPIVGCVRSAADLKQFVSNRVPAPAALEEK